MQDLLILLSMCANWRCIIQTDVVDQVKYLYAWNAGVYGKYDRTATWDCLQAFIDEGHRLGLKVHAAINTFHRR